MRAAAGARRAAAPAFAVVPHGKPFDAEIRFEALPETTGPT